MLGKLGTRSLATRLFLSAGVLSVTILLVAGLILSAVYRSGAEDAFDERLGVYLRALVAELATDKPGDDKATEKSIEAFQLPEPLFELPQSGWYWQITRLNAQKPQIFASPSLFASRLPRLADKGVGAGMGGARRGYAKGPDDRVLRIIERVIDAGDQGIYLIQVAATTDDIDGAISDFEFSISVTFAVLAVLLVASSALQLRFGLIPLRRLQAGVTSIRRGEVDRIDGVFPSDIAPLANELNLMIEANREVVERARTQVGNLAHGLKTPLSVIINEASVEKSPFSEKVSEQAAVMRDQVSYYLERARAAVSARKIGSATDVSPVVEGLVRTFEKIYRDRNVVFTEVGGQGIRFLGERQDLEEMIGNLVDNAGKWAAHEVKIGISSEVRDRPSDRSFFRVTIDDDGPGLLPSQWAAAIKRGQRLDESKPGTGLGLSIVDELASLYGGVFRLDTSPTSGLRAVLTLPAS